jgi:threonine/homoserine/homoserine lactone efflux protein
MDTLLFPLLRGLVIGLAIGAPVGPIGALIIRRSLASGFLPGFLTGLGAATADAIYGACAAFGFTVVTRSLLAVQFWLGVIGGAFLCYLAIKASVQLLPATPPRSATTACSPSMFPRCS